MIDSKYFYKAQNPKDKDGTVEITYSDTIYQKGTDLGRYEYELSKDYIILSAEGGKSTSGAKLRTIIKGRFNFNGYELVSGTLLEAIMVTSTGYVEVSTLKNPVSIVSPIFDIISNFRVRDNAVFTKSMGEYSKFFPAGWSNRLFEDDLVSTNGISSGSEPVQSSITYALGANEENLTLTGTAAINGTGNGLNNVLSGNGAANILNGGAGSDSMNGGGGNDTYVVDSSGDIVVEELNAGKDTVQSSITYALGANVENLTLTGTAAINGTGNTLNNVLTGNSAANILTGGLGNDTYVIGAGDTVVELANQGTDTVQSSITYALGANVENLTLTGTAAINGTGNTLNNVLTGNSAVNTLTGGVGKDVLTGLGGADTFRYTALTDSLITGFDRITDFAIGTDRMDGPTAVSAANTKELGTVASFNQVGISAVLTAAVFGANQAATFTFGSGIGTRTFLALNNGTSGFSSTTDSVIEITGYSGLLTNLSIISGV